MGFVYICGTSRRGALQVQRKTRGDRMRAKLREIKEALRERCTNRSPRRGNGSPGGGQGLLYVPRRAHEFSGPRRAPLPRYRAVVTHASAARPEGPYDVGPDHAARGHLAPTTKNPSSLAGSALRRQSPKVGPESPNRAGSDLCEGCRVTRISTAITGCFPSGSTHWVQYPENPVAPFRRKSTGPFMPKTEWLHYAHRSQAGHHQAFHLEQRVVLSLYVALDLYSRWYAGGVDAGTRTVRWPSSCSPKRSAAWHQGGTFAPPFLL